MNCKKGDCQGTLLSRNDIPIIDLGFNGSETALTKDWFEGIAKQLNYALSTKGLVFFVNHSITEEKLQTVNKIMDEFCALPDSIKDQYKVENKQCIQGYIPPGMESLDSSVRKEIRHCYNITSLSQKLPMEEVPNFKGVVASVAKDFINLAQVLLKVMAIALGLDPEEFLRLHKGMMKKDNNTTFRMLYYPPLGEDCLENTTRCGEHTDWGTVTLLIEDVEGGLEILHNGEWCRVGHLPGAIMMNLGDLMEKWCSSKYKAVRHRVVIPDEEDLRKKGRHSIAFFVQPDHSTVVDASLFTRGGAGVEAGGQRGQEKKLSAYDYMQQKLSESLNEKYIAK